MGKNPIVAIFAALMRHIIRIFDSDDIQRYKRRLNHC